MKNYTSIKKAEYMHDYKISLKFNDGKKHIVDFKNFIFKSQHPDIVKYKDVNIFKKFNFKYGEIEWNDFGLSFPITDLYLGNIG